MLTELHLKDIGPADAFNVNFGDRLTVFTGDNGLGKSFILDTAWWMVAQTEVNLPLIPRSENKTAILNCLFDGDSYDHSISSLGQASGPIWLKPKRNFLLLYAHPNGDFSLMDSVRNRRFQFVNGVEVSKLPSAYHFVEDTLWNGLEKDGKVLCNGLIHDWVRWQFNPVQEEDSPFQILTKVLKHLSPHSQEQLLPAQPVRTSIEDVRDVPALKMPYGVVPVTHASAGVKRILSLAYILTWAWYEHRQAAKSLNIDLAENLILLCDEVEAHLHPQWQRVILPALLDISSCLESSLNVQLVLTTHAPLVLASLEPYFDDSKDRLYLFTLDNTEVKLNEVPWAQQGDAVGWLTSEVFGLDDARSVEGERAIDAAEDFMIGKIANLPPDLSTEDQIHQELLRVVPGDDPFWPGWLLYTKRIPE